MAPQSLSRVFRITCDRNAGNDKTTGRPATKRRVVVALKKPATEGSPTVLPVESVGRNNEDVVA
jgi:hypothetical protein